MKITWREILYMVCARLGIILKKEQSKLIEVEEAHENQKDFEKTASTAS